MFGASRCLHWRAHRASGARYRGPMNERMFDPDAPRSHPWRPNFTHVVSGGWRAGPRLGLFAGIGGIELGLAGAGLQPELLCECWDPAKVVLSERFPGVPLVGDIREVKSLPNVDVVTAGFPVPISPRRDTLGV